MQSGTFRRAQLQDVAQNAYERNAKTERNAKRSLLCTQRWRRAGSSGAWRLAQHRTIPYTPDLDAPACLRCDHRGCVALVREGLAGPPGMPGDGRA